MRSALQIHKGKRKRRLSASQIVVKRFCEYHRGAVPAKPSRYAFQIQNRAKRMRRDRKLAENASEFKRNRRTDFQNSAKPLWKNSENAHVVMHND